MIMFIRTVNSSTYALSADKEDATFGFRARRPEQLHIEMCHKKQKHAYSMSGDATRLFHRV